MSDISVEMADAFAFLLNDGFAPEYIEVALQHIREWSIAPDCRDDIKKFVIDTADLSGMAVVVLTSDNITLLKNSEGHLLAFS